MERFFRTLWMSPITLWVGFVTAHLWVSGLGMFGPGNPLGDISGVYTFWAGHAYAGDFVVGIDTPWVYPIVALIPILFSGIGGMDNYVPVFLGVVAVVNAVVFAILIGRAPRNPRAVVAAWWWLALIVCLGPVALGRIDAIATPLGLLGLLVVSKHPRVAGALFALGAWVKVWPAALALAAFVAMKKRREIVIGALIVTGAVVAIALVLGSGVNVLSFVTQQTARGLQIEAPAATAYLWQVNFGDPGVGLYYDRDILTFQVSAPGVEIVGSLTTVLMAIAVAALVGLGILMVRRGVDESDIVIPLALALTVALIAFNKVGSPQFMGWLAVPIVCGLAAGGKDFRLPAVVTLVMALLTQAIYPYGYDNLLRVNAVELAMLTVRNALEFVLLAIAVRMIMSAPAVNLDRDVEKSSDVGTHKL